jgi:hypothetical protein
MHTAPSRILLLLVLGCPGEAVTQSGRAAPDEAETVLAAGDPPLVREVDVEPTLEQLVGSYRHAGGASEQAALEQAIDDVVAGMNVLARGIARKRLLESNRIPGTVEITGNAERLTIAFEDREYTAAVGGAAVDVIGVTGDPLRMTLRVRKRALIQKFVGDKGDRTNTMTSRQGGLRIAVLVSSDSLPKDLAYTLTFAR